MKLKNRSEDFVMYALCKFIRKYFTRKRSNSEEKRSKRQGRRMNRTGQGIVRADYGNKKSREIIRAGYGNKMDF